jgi:ABC-2 type transport system permease protein
MNNFTALVQTKFWGLKNRLSGLFHQSKLKIIVIFLATLGFWFGMYLVFAEGYDFLAGFPDIGIDFLTEYLFGLLFLALTLMLVVSNAIISFSGLYKARETEFLIPFPVTNGSLFGYKLMESLSFSSWAFLFLVTPFLFAYGIHRGLPLSFYPLSVIFILIYLFIPAGLGIFISMMIATYMPRRKRQIILVAVALAIGLTTVLISQLIELRGTALTFTVRWMEEFLSRFSFAQNPILPSYWLVQGVMSSARANLHEITFFFLFILSQSLFIVLLLTLFARRYYLAGYSRMQSSRSDKKYPAATWIDSLGGICLFLLPRPLREIIIKDIKSLLRDPVQWSQSLIFFGLLGVYFVNLRNLPYLQNTERFWQFLISFLNLMATSLTMATFTTRFVYPQLSLEGQRFWVIGMAPITRRTIVYGKFLLALISSLVISESLMFVSNQMLRISLYDTLLQAYTVFIICLGLSGLAVGFGAIYPNLKEDNPSKMVAGFGGTLTLVLSMIFVLSIVFIQAAPSHLYHQFRYLGRHDLYFWRMVTTGLITLIGLAAAYFPLRYGLKSIERLEV